MFSLNELDPLESIAGEKNWIALGGRLSEAMRRFREYDLRSPEDALREVARLQGGRPMSLARPLAAAEWLRQHHPNVFASRSETVPMTNVLQLRTLHAIAPEHATRIANDVFAGSLSRKMLRQILDEARQANFASRVSRKGPSALNKEFERALGSYLKLNLGELTGSHHAALRDGGNVRPPADFLIEVDGKIMVAVEAKVSRTNLHERKLLEMLGLVALRQRHIPHSIIVGTEDWSSDFAHLDKLARDFGISNLSLATFTDSTPARMNFIRKKF